MRSGEPNKLPFSIPTLSISTSLDLGVMSFGLLLTMDHQKENEGNAADYSGPGSPLQSSAEDGERISAAIPIAPAHDPTLALVTAAQALIDRWESPLWKDVPHTGTFIHALKVALADFVEKGWGRLENFPGDKPPRA